MTPGIIRPVASPTHVASPGAPGLAILSFQADRATIMPGEVFTLTWESMGATQAWLYPLVGSRLPQGVPVSPTGSQIVTAPLHLRQPPEYILFVLDRSGVYVSRSLRLPLRGCPEQRFFPNAPTECPSGPPVVSFAAYQPFERGHAIWIQARDEIFVLSADEQGHQGRVFIDLLGEGRPEYDPALTPPPGLFQSIRGFGLVWRNDPGVRARPGWALQLEQGFTTRIQMTAREHYNILFAQAPDGGTWQLDPEGSGWSHHPPSGSFRASPLFSVAAEEGRGSEAVFLRRLNLQRGCCGLIPMRGFF
ncbi:hypothetical protein [Thermoflexus sp.]|uniref:hypothetical protein n=1 Tax=Thermoflexus sp. TaxID=1969742 RepID=UPI0035E46004